MRGRMSSLILILVYISVSHENHTSTSISAQQNSDSFQPKLITDSQKIKIMLKAAQLINKFKDVFIKFSKFPLFRFPGIVDFYPRDSRFFQIWGFLSRGLGIFDIWGFLSRRFGIFLNLGIYIPGIFISRDRGFSKIWEFLSPGIGDFFVPEIFAESRGYLRNTPIVK